MDYSEFNGDSFDWLLWYEFRKICKNLELKQKQKLTRYVTKLMKEIKVGIHEQFKIWTHSEPLQVHFGLSLNFNVGSWNTESTAKQICHVKPQEYVICICFP